MFTGQLEQFVCDGCAKSYRWKPELAGKRVKCKCGQTMTVPLPPVVEEPIESDDPFGDALSAMVEAERTAPTDADSPRCPTCHSEMPRGSMLCTECGYNVATGKTKKFAKTSAGPMPTGVGGADDGGFSLAPSAAGPVVAARPVGMLAYAGMPVRKSLSAAGGVNAGNSNIVNPVTDVFLPIGLLALGVVMTFLEARYGRGIASIQVALLFTVFTVVINLALVFAGIMLAVRLLELGLGPLGPALLKIAAVSVLPGAVANMLLHVFGPSGFFFVWIISLSLIYGMFMGLLGLDFHETGICSCIIWVMRTWIGYAIVFAILNGMGMRIAPAGSTASGAMAALGGGSSTGRLKSPTPPKPKVTSAQLDAHSMSALQQPGAVEARRWVKGASENEGHEIPRFGDGPSFRAVDGIYSEGAVNVMITRAKRTHPRELVVRQLVIALPAQKFQREMLFGWGKSITKEFGGTSQFDVGQQYLLVDFDGQAGPDTEDPADEVDPSAPVGM